MGAAAALDEHRLNRLTLIEAGVRHATRAHLVAATVLLGGPTIAEDARALMAERRAHAFRDALAAGLPGTPSSSVRWMERTLDLGEHTPVGSLTDRQRQALLRRLRADDQPSAPMGL